MKKLLLALFSFCILSCNPDVPPDKESTVIVTYISGGKDTIRFQYYQDLHLSGTDLNDANYNTKVSFVIGYSILNTNPISK